MAGGDLYKQAIFHALLQEVDFVLRAGDHIVAIEVKSGRRRERLLGMEAFSKAFRVKVNSWSENKEFQWGNS
jgi:hypothetical protein